MHQSLNESLPKMCRRTAGPSAALVAGLKRRGLLGTTLVFWGGEMGRLPVVRAARAGKTQAGRDHNTDGFSVRLAGGWVKGGQADGATDEWGLHAVDKVIRHPDYLATVMHLFGPDAEKLVFKRNGRAGTILDGQPGEPVAGLLA